MIDPDVEDLLDSLTCPQCGEYKERIAKSIFFPGYACSVCDLAEEQRHIEQGCDTPDCPCETAPDTPEGT